MSYVVFYFLLNKLWNYLIVIYGINQYLWFINKLSYDFIYFVTELDIDKFYCLATAMKIPDMRVEESNGVPTSEFLCPAEPKVFYSVKI